MIITIDRDTLPNEMHHIAIALQRIAAENGYVASKTSTSVGELTVELNIDTTDATAAIDKLAAHAAAKGVDVTDIPPAPLTTVINAAGETLANVDLSKPDSVEKSGDGVSYGYTITQPTTDTNLDVNGLPWDARIHAGSRERNTDGSWRVRRRPKGVEEAEWEATLARVTAELTDLMAIPVSPGAVADAAAEEAQVLGDTLETALYDALINAPAKIVSESHPLDLLAPHVQPAVDKAIDDGVVAPPVTIAPPVVVPPVTAVAPPITVDKPAIETFAQLMSWLTSRTPKDEAAKPAMVTRVNEILAANGLTTLQQLGQRGDLIPQVLVQFREAFGE